MLYVIPFISAGIGWFTNFIAIKMLFHPREEVNLGIFRLQGIFPKRQRALARKLARIVARDLFTVENMKQKLAEEMTEERLIASIKYEVEQYLRVKVLDKAPLLNSIIDEKRLIQIRDRICREIVNFLPQMINQLDQKLDKVDVEETVYVKVSAFSSEKLEGLLMGVIKSELAFIELAGAILGFIIGLIQILLVNVAVGS
jgi:uncharacterized membrane protein YheB (UPF0754 family)